MTAAVAAVAMSTLAPATATVRTADPIQPVSPVAPITVDPIDPIAPISPQESPSTTGGGPTGPVGPRAPRGPQGVPGPAGAAGDAAAAATRAGQLPARVAELTARLSTLGTSDAVPLGGAEAEAALQTLQDGRELFAGQVDAPQVQVGADGCPTSAPDGTLRQGAGQIGVAQLCADSVAQAATPEAAQAIKWAFAQLGAPYACGGVGRMEPYKFDCSSLVTRAYYEGAGLNTAGKDWAPSTRDLLPWDGVPLADWAAKVDPENARPGDLLVYRTCTSDKCAYQHVTMLLADGYMLHTNRCGDVAHVTTSWGFGDDRGFQVARRVDPEKAR